MYRGTTPQLTFTFPFEPAVCSRLTLAFSQGEEVILVKELDSCKLSGNTLTVKLTEEDTLKFDCRKLWVEMQFRIVIGDDVLASKIMKVEVKRILYDEVLCDEI